MKIFGPANLIFYLKLSNYYFKSFKREAVKFVGFDIGFSDFEAKLLDVSKTYDIDIISAIEQGFYLTLFLQKLD